VIGWGNLTARDGQLQAGFGYVDGRAPRERTFRRALEAEMARLREFMRGRATD
jgi:hypothetical protein